MRLLAREDGEIDVRAIDKSAGIACATEAVAWDIEVRPERKDARVDGDGAVMDARAARGEAAVDGARTDVVLIVRDEIRGRENGCMMPVPVRAIRCRVVSGRTVWMKALEKRVWEQVVRCKPGAGTLERADEREEEGKNGSRHGQWGAENMRPAGEGRGIIGALLGGPIARSTVEAPWDRALRRVAPCCSEVVLKWYRARCSGILVCLSRREAGGSADDADLRWFRESLEQIIIVRFVEGAGASIER